jgi:hypothetical protein
MPGTINQMFRITVPITKCYLRKFTDGAEKYGVEGMASNADLDLTGGRFQFNDQTGQVDTGARL